MTITRRPSRLLHVGDVPVGGDSPITVQSMTTTKTADVDATLAQVYSLAGGGADIVRITCNDVAAAQGLAEIVPRSPVPIIADIHFQYRLALAAIEAGVAGLRLNPGNIRKEEHIKAVARAGSFTTASNNLAITQSALTKSVAEVEHLLGIKLFQRLPRGVVMTEAGARFVPRAERILADTQELMTELDELQSLAAGHLRIGVAPAGFIGFLEHAVSDFAGVYPGIKIEVVDSDVEAVVSAVIQGEMDLVVGIQPNLVQWTELSVTVIATMNQFFISRLGHPLAELHQPTAQDLMQYPLVLPSAGFTTQAQIAKAYIDAGITPRPAHYVVDHFPLVERLVAATDAVAPVVTTAAPGKVFHEQFKVYEDVVQLDAQVLAVGHAKRREFGGPAAAFVDLFKGFRHDGV